MKLRNFLYLNTKVLEDYVAAIDGYIYDEESQEIATSSETLWVERERLVSYRGTVRTLESDPKKSKDLCILVTPQSLKKSINIFDRMTKD